MTGTVAVVTGGSSALALRTARLLAREHHVVLSDRSRERLHRALDQLDSLAVSAEAIVADPADRRSVDLLLTAAREAGPIATVVHDATTSPASSPAEIVRARVLGTMHVTAATLAVAGLGTTLVHAAPAVRAPRARTVLPRRLLRLAATDPEALARGLTRLAELAPVRSAPAVAHALSGAFVDWYATHMAERFDACGARLSWTDTAPAPGGTDVGAISRAS